MNDWKGNVLLCFNYVLLWKYFYDKIWRNYVIKINPAIYLGVFKLAKKTKKQKNKNYLIRMCMTPNNDRFRPTWNIGDEQ